LNLPSYPQSSKFFNLQLNQSSKFFNFQFAAQFSIGASSAISARRQQADIGSAAAGSRRRRQRLWRALGVGGKAWFGSGSWGLCSAAAAGP
jgi:hypothetical protein